MSLIGTLQAPLSVRMKDKRDLRMQFGALCYRIVKDKPQILLITSRESRRWIVPKGWPMEGLRPSEAAETEAWEEAGVKGTAFDHCLGLYSYVKRAETGDLPCAVLLYPVKVKSLAEDFPEARERKRAWFSRKKAATLVDEPDLAALLKSFDPRKLKR